MSNQFSIQVTPELMYKLTRDQKNASRKKSGRRKQESTPVLPTDQSVESNGEGGSSSFSGFPGRDGYLPPFLGPQAPYAGLFTPPAQPVELSAESRKTLELYQRLMEESTNVSQKIREEADQELEKVRKMAEELKDKQYRAPSRAPVCLAERASCVECYKQNQKNPLLCADVVQSFVKCSRRAQEAFVASAVS